jgi:hypothetical protein
MPSKECTGEASFLLDGFRESKKYLTVPPNAPAVAFDHGRSVKFCEALPFDFDQEKPTERRTSIIEHPAVDDAL